MILTQEVLNDLIFNLKSKYKNILQGLRLECKECTGNTCSYISLIYIGIKKSQQKKGYGSIILSEVIKVADKYKIPIKLWITDIFGIEKKVLIGFYQRHGFVLVGDLKIKNVMWYYPN